MPRGQSNGQIFPAFSNMLAAFKSHAQSIVGGLRGGQQRKWFDGKTQPFDISGMHKELFGRDDLNAKYAECMKSVEGAGTVADIIVIKRQIDYMAAAERAHRLRQASTARLLAHATARRVAHGSGGTFDAVEQVLADTLRAGSARSA